MWAVTIFAFRRGGREERFAAVGLVVTSYATPFLLSPYNVRYRHVEAPVFALDTACLLFLTIIGLRSRKFWPMWLAAMQGLTVLAHLLPYMPLNRAFIYYNAAALWSYPMWILLAFAVSRCSRQAASPRG